MHVINKICPSVEAALADIPDGATIMIAGFGTAGMPSELIDGLIAHGARDLTIINNNAGNGETGLAALLANKRVRKQLCVEVEALLRIEALGDGREARDVGEEHGHLLALARERAALLEDALGVEVGHEQAGLTFRQGSGAERRPRGGLRAGSPGSPSRRPS